MNGLRHHEHLARFNDGLRCAGQGVLMLDFDGTLAPFARDLREVLPYEGVAGCLDALMSGGRARVIIVTGRFLKDAPPDLGTKHTPEMFGSHGRERQRPDGRYEVAGIDDVAVAALTVADSWSRAVEADGGRSEFKPGSVAFHWRGLGDDRVALIRRLVTERFHQEALAGVLDLHSFDGGMELRAPGPGKGEVVRTILRETAAHVPVAYLGDDVTDEDAFAALRERGLSILVRPEYRTTGANLWIRPPDELIAVLQNWIELLGGRK